MLCQSTHATVGWLVANANNYNVWWRVKMVEAINEDISMVSSS